MLSHVTLGSSIKKILDRDLTLYQMASMLTTILLLVGALIFGTRAGTTVFVVAVILSVFLWFVTRDAVAFLVGAPIQVLLWIALVMDSPIANQQFLERFTTSAVSSGGAVLGAIGAFVVSLIQLVLAIIWGAAMIMILIAMGAAVLSGRVTGRGYRRYQGYSEQFEEDD